MAALLGFPSQFSFPAPVSTKQQFKLRISVLVVALLIVALFTYLAPPQVSDPTGSAPWHSTACRNTTLPALPRLRGCGVRIPAPDLL